MSKPKKMQAPSAYIMFCVRKRSEVQQANPNATFGDLGRMLGSIWKSMSESDKEVSISKVHNFLRLCLTFSL